MASSRGNSFFFLFVKSVFLTNYNEIQNRKKQKKRMCKCITDHIILEEYIRYVHCALDSVQEGNTIIVNLV